ncbi:chymotrypsin inhibitor-like [Calliopsis andreniformis]|uniref:chymotrypsin inhibitor-like n=1 Tax=Calliopsis andreniformis TaxID=337506 RepID=UPI003FCC5113
MSRFTFALFALFAIIFSAQAAKCPPGEVWSDCGSACQPSCLKPKPLCTLQCVSGCFCPDGLVRNNNGKCIPKSNCWN